VVTANETETIQADAEQRLAKLLRQCARLTTRYRHDPDPDIREELNQVDSRVTSCKRSLSDYRPERGNRLLWANGVEVRGWGPVQSPRPAGARLIDNGKRTKARKFRCALGGPRRGQPRGRYYRIRSLERLDGSQ